MHATDMEAAIAEFRQAVGDLFNSPERRRIELLKSRIAAMAPRAHGRVILQHELRELLSQQLRRELAA